MPSRWSGPGPAVHHRAGAVHHREPRFVTFRLAAGQSAANMAAMLAEGMFVISLAVRIYDAAEVPEHHLAAARSTVEGIMKKGAGVGVTWTTCPCTSPVRSNEVVVRIAAAAPPASSPVSLGFSLVDIGRRAGTLATVFVDRVTAMAALAGVDQGELLGRVIAHEIAHLLIGTNDHSPRGLMRGAWRASELARQRPADWLLSTSEGLRIRQAIGRRASGPPPVMIASDDDGTSSGTLQ